MPDIFTPLLLSACLGVSAPYEDACRKAAEAGYIQTGYSAQATTFQSGAAGYFKNKEHAVFGKNEWIVNDMAVVAVAAKTKKANVVLPNLGMCDKLSTELQPNVYGLKFGWKW